MRFRKTIDGLSRICLTLGLLICVFPSSADSALDAGKSKDKPPLNQTKDDTKKPNPNKQLPQQPVVAPQSQQGQNKAPDAAENAGQKTSSDWWIVYLTGALVLVGICQIIAMGVQAYWMQGTMVVAKQSADAATATVRAMEETAERQLRAYVHPVSAERFRDDAGVVVIQLKIKNCGQTPACNCRYSMIEAIWNGFPAPASAFANAPPPAMGAAVIAPGELVEFFVSAETITPQDEIRIAEKKKAIYLFGEIAYTDVFNKKRVTKYRLVCFGEWLRTGRFAASEEGNEAT